MSEKAVLVTGACGEIGQALVQQLASRGGYRIVTADIAPLPEAIKSLVAEHVQGDLVNRIKQFYDYDFDIIFHLAASLSSKAEVATEEAHRINVEGTMQLLMLAAYRSEKYNKAVKFLFPSSIAAYGFPNLEAKTSRGGGQGGRVQHAAHDVRLQQALLRKTGDVLQPLQRTAPPRPAPAGDVRLPRHPLPRADQRLHPAQRRDKRLRSRDAACRRARQALRMLRARGYEDLVHGHARCDQVPVDADGGRRARSSRAWSTTSPRLR